MASTLEELAQASIHLEEVAATVRHLVEGVESDPQRLEQAESRLAEYERLTRKYRIDADALLERREEIEREIAALEIEERSHIERLRALQEEQKAAYDSLEAALAS